MSETELKFEVAAGDLKRLAKHSAFKPKAERARLRSAYFDTPEHTLRDAGFSLRVRTKGRRYVQTVKSGAGRGLFDRDEWETDVQGRTPDLDALADTPAGKRLNGHAGRLETVFVTAIDRAARTWIQGDTVIEIAVDRGEIKAGDTREAVLELELELKCGSEQALYSLAEELAELAPLRLSFISKSERGYRLATGQAGAAVRAGDVTIAPEAGTGEAFRVIMRSCLAQLSDNARALSRTQDPGVLHQARIGLRRLRAALSLFKRVVGDDVYPHLKHEARWIALQLNAARDLDVFLEKLDPTDRAFGGDPAVGKFAKRAVEVRAKAYAAALAALESPRFARFVLKTALWVENGPWTSGDNPERDGSVAPFAAAALDRLWKVVRKQAKDLAGIDDAARHEVRIRSKKLRYAVEFFAGAFPDEAKRRKRFQEAVRALQDALGVLNDIATARETAVRVTGASRAPDLSFGAGLVVSRIRGRRSRALKAAVRAGDALAETRRFWT